MKKIITLLALIFFVNVKAQTWQWAKSGNGHGCDEGIATATDTTGNVFITGTIQGPSITFGTDTLITSGYNMFITKYDANGNVLWAKKSEGGALGNEGSSVSTDISGNVFITGAFSGTSITIGTFTLNNAGGTNMFIAKYDANGNVLWAKRAGGTIYDYGASVSTDAAGNAFVTGSFQSPTIIFGTYTLTNVGSNTNVFIAKYDANGNVLWAKSIGGFSAGTSVSTDATGNVFVTGGFDSPTVTLGTYTLTDVGSTDVFVAKYDANGNVLWAKGIGGTNTDIGNSISTDVTGNVFVTGSFISSTIAFGTYTLTNAGTTDNIFVVKYDANGNVLWALSAGGVGKGGQGDIGYSLSGDITGNVFVTGGFYSPSITFGIYTLIPPVGSSDPMFVVKYDANGNVLCASALESGGDDNSGVSADRYGNAYVVSDFEEGPFIVGSTILPFTSTVVGGESVFFAKWECNNTSAGIMQLASNKEQVSIYPNPNNGSFVIEPNSATKQTMQVYDVSGKLVLSQAISGKTSIDAGSLNEGVYNISLQSNEGVINKRLVIVR